MMTIFDEWHDGPEENEEQLRNEAEALLQADRISE